MVELKTKDLRKAPDEDSGTPADNAQQLLQRRAIRIALAARRGVVRAAENGSHYYTGSRRSVKPFRMQWAKDTSTTSPKSEPPRSNTIEQKKAASTYPPSKEAAQTEHLEQPVMQSAVPSAHSPVIKLPSVQKHNHIQKHISPTPASLSSSSLSDKKTPMPNGMGKNDSKRLSEIRSRSNSDFKSGKTLKYSPQAMKTAVPAPAQPALQVSNAMESVKRSEQVSKLVQGTTTAVKKASGGTARAARAIAEAGSELFSALCAGSGVILVLVVLLVVMGFAGMMFAGDEDDAVTMPVSEEVKAYEPLIRIYARKHGIPDYVQLIEAVMMQESGGRGDDPMQCSESGHNTMYPHALGSITDPEYSIDVGIQTLAEMLKQADVESPVDMEHIKLSLQGYNFGGGYISWAVQKYDGYSKANAIEFSLMMAKRYGWNSYGDKQYVSHVLRFYPIGQLFYEPDRTPVIVDVAASQIGNVGGEPYWRWYGLSERVAWCAIFVSWCADQCGYIADGTIPKFAGCLNGVERFRERNQWADRSITPEPGMIIFFDWNDPETGRDGLPDHVGIVEKAENGYVYTIEGNTADSCRRRQYSLGSASILGYGIPSY